ncbi:hypothetical protein [Candidatus Tisiphia endosymbiont of Nemotelus uliginosus]|uniref:hypothetical protein n=1 Tax=Candidatus Tisiphia endosymbiont of Nemotelus uliginosus TaxID=3077926 RepID=UPI0035C8C453
MVKKQQHIATEMPISPPTPPPPYQAADKEQPKQQHITTETPIPPPVPTPSLKGPQEKNKSSSRRSGV